MSDPREDLIRVAECLEKLSKSIAPIATPGNTARMTKDEAFACLSYLANAGVAMRSLAAWFGAMQEPKGEA